MIGGDDRQFLDRVRDRLSSQNECRIILVSCGSFAGCRDDPQEWILSDKRCMLTISGVAKLEAALKDHFGCRPSDQKVADAFSSDRKTVAKIRTPNPTTLLNHGSIEKLFEMLGLELFSEDYEQVVVPAKPKLSDEGTAVIPNPSVEEVRFNPFGETGAISNPNQFWNRQQLLREIFEEIEKGSNQSLIGKSGVGKSSILKMVCSKWENNLRNRRIEKCIYLDMRAANDEQDFFEMLCKSIGIEPLSGSQLSRALRGKQYIVCIDEVKCLANSSFFTGREINQLSGLSDGSEQPLILIVSSREPLEVIFPETPAYSSAFPGLFLRVNIDEFSKKNLRDFINSKLHQIGVNFNESQIEEIWNVSDGNPRRIQQEARRIFHEIRTTGA
jgi:hypothetical protein